MTGETGSEFVLPHPDDIDEGFASRRLTKTVVARNMRKAYEDGIWDTDHPGYIPFINQATPNAKGLLNLTPDELRAQYRLAWECNNPDSVPAKPAAPTKTAAPAATEATKPAAAKTPAKPAATAPAKTETAPAPAASGTAADAFLRALAETESRLSAAIGNLGESIPQQTHDLLDPRFSRIETGVDRIDARVEGIHAGLGKLGNILLGGEGECAEFEEALNAPFDAYLERVQAEENGGRPAAGARRPTQGW